MKKKLLYSFLLGLFAIPGAWSANYGLPAGIQEGNILHCFNWKLSDIKAELPNIAAAGFGSVQVSPLQRNVSVGSGWSDAYRPYDFKFIGSAGLGSAEDLKSLCQEAEKYGIKVIVDVVENHVDGHGAGDHSLYHDPWWNSNNRLRWYGDVSNWNDRGQVTKNQMGGGDGYPDVNSEDSEVAARGKAYIEELKNMGVKGIRFDAAKHIGLPSEGCQFWATVTSVPGLYYYGEILDGPGGNGDALMKEYTKYMSVTDNNYGNQATQNNGVPGGHAGWCASTIPANKTVYWGESHDTYANNDGFSKNLSQDQVDRGYAIVACRNGETALYLSRPSAKNFGDIKIGIKGSTAYANKQIAEVNKFRNAMVGRADYFSGGNGVASVTRKDGGAVIVANGGNRNISVANGGGYCPAGTYTDRVSGGTFTVTASTITGNVGPSGIAVIYADGVTPPPTPDPTPGPTPDPTPGGSYWLLGNIDGAQWSTTGGATFTSNGNAYVAKNVKLTAKTGETKCYFNITDATGADWDELNIKANRFGPATEGVAITLGETASVTKYANNVDASNCKSWTLPAGSYDFTFNPSALTLVVTNAGGTPDPTPGPTPNPDPTPTPGDDYYVYFDDMSKTDVAVWAWVASTEENCTNAGGQGWPGDKMTLKDGKYYWALPAGKSVPTNIIISWGEHKDADKAGGKDLVFVNKATYHADGSYTEYVNPNPNPNPTPDPDPIPGPTPGPDPVPTPTGNNLITEYFKVNPNGKVGSNKTISMSFNEQKSTTALSNWTEAELIAQGVARDVCQAFKGVHERPIVDSYALYAAYDSQNLYLGVQYVYTIWDIGGEGKQPGESKPYNMDGKLCFAFDLNPNVSAKGITNENSSIWQNKVFTTFENGSDAWWYGSTKPGVGKPGFFVPNANGICDYTDPESCKESTVKYGYADGLLPSITAVYGQDDFSYDPELLKGNTGFIDLRSEIDDSAHTFYEYTFPLALLGVTEDYIKNNGIGVMVVDFYGSSAHSSLPYDPSFFDNVNEAYSADDSSSGEKEDQDIVTYAHARIGKLASSAVESLPVESVDADVAPVYYNLQGVRVDNPSKGLYIVVRGNKVSKEIVR
ncbi:MAG: hypothetical protein K2J82_03695 [Muribaculaceae bacterium]|nr:hypothetical protein [Muribaculaceae bacterium]